MWDLTIHADHDFYIDTVAGSVLVHNDSCAVYRTARVGLGQGEADNGLDPDNFATGDKSAYVGDEAAARSLANPSVGNYENFYTRFEMRPEFEQEFNNPNYKFEYPEGGSESYEYQLPRELISRFNELTISRTIVQF